MPDINVLIKPASGLCNMRCDYCFYEDEMKNREISSYGMMTEETLENIIRKAVEESNQLCTFAYQGGEPTLIGLDFFKKAAELQKKYHTKKKLRIENVIQTNGLNLDDTWLDFLKENNFLVGISLDGTAYSHDAFRKDEKGNGTYERVLHAIEGLKKKEIPFNILTVVNSKTVKQVSRIYDFYKREGFFHMQFIPCLNPFSEEEIKYPYTLSTKAYGQFLKSLFDLWYQDIKNNNYIHIQLFENYIMLLLGKAPELCGLSGSCSRQYIIEADGEVYPCDFYVLDRYRLGNLNKNSFSQIEEKREETGFIRQSQTTCRDCLTCKFFSVCRGGCKRHREPAIHDIYGKNRFCEAYYDFFDYSFERMAELANYYFHL